LFRNLVYDANNVTLEILLVLEGDADMDVDITDFNFIAANFGDYNPAAPNQVPESDTLALLLLVGLLGFLGWRRQPTK